MGAIESNPLIVAASGTEVFLFTADGELIERVANGFAPPISAIGLHKQTVVLNTSAGPVASTDDFLSWQKLPHDSAIHWANTSDAPRKLLASLPQSTGVSWERFLLDIHAGRILGPVRVIIADLAALGMILLALTGFYTWLTRYRRKR